MSEDTNKAEFLNSVRAALGNSESLSREIPEVTGLAHGLPQVQERVVQIKNEMSKNEDALFDEFEISARSGGWEVVRVPTYQDAAACIEQLIRKLGITTAMRSAHTVLDNLELEAKLLSLNIGLTLMAFDEQVGGRQTQRQKFRDEALNTGLGITGVDWVIAETGSAVIEAKAGVSRLVSLLPPIHVAVALKGQVVKSLDELFVLRRNDYLATGALSYVNIITGPSRSADIDQTLVKGMHGPKEVHMIMVEQQD